MNVIILINESNQVKLHELLTKQGLRALELRNEQQAWENVRQAQPDVIIKKISKLDQASLDFFEEYKKNNVYYAHLVVLTPSSKNAELQRYLNNLNMRFKAYKQQSEINKFIEVISRTKIRNNQWHEHIANNLSKKIKSIEELSLKLTGLVKLHTDMARQNKSQELNKLFCHEAKKIVNAELSMILLPNHCEPKLTLIDCNSSNKNKITEKTIAILNQFNEAALLNGTDIPFNSEDFYLNKTQVFGSMIIVPLYCKENKTGYALFFKDNNKKRFNDEDLFLAESLGLHFSLTSDNILLTTQLEQQKNILQEEVQKVQCLEKQLQLQYAVAKILAESPNLLVATPKILETACSKLDCSLGNIWAVEPETNTLRCVNSWSKDYRRTKFLEQSSRDVKFKKNEGIPGIAWEGKAYYFSKDLKEEMNSPRYFAAKKTGYQMALAFPIMFKDEVLGVLEFISGNFSEPKKPLIDIFSAVCNQIASFIKTTRAEKELLYLIDHDPLTRLANRNQLLRSLENAILRAKHHHSRIAVLYLDLDNFKTINDTLGHPIGDKLLIKVANQLKSRLRSQDILARVAGDEFAIVLQNVNFTESVAVVAQKILNVLTAPFSIEDHECYISASIGISIYPNDGNDANTLLKNADLALYKAKEAGKNNYQFCNSEITRMVQARMTMENNLRRACKLQNEFLLCYQPSIDVKTGRIKSIEALLRWQLPTGEVLLPCDFLAIAEETNLISPITEWVLRTACEANCKLQKENSLYIPMTVNISGKDFFRNNFTNKIREILEDTKIEPEYLQLEITESIINRNLKNSLLIIDRLKNIGVKISIDDLGIGASTFEYLKAYMVDIVKIKQASIKNITTDQSDLAIVSAIIALAHKMDMKVVAKGVEKQDQLDLMLKENCDQYQGYYCCHPKTLDDLIKFLKGKWSLAA